MSMTLEVDARPDRGAAWRPTLGAWPEGSGTRFQVWAPEARDVEVIVEKAGGAGSLTQHLKKGEHGTFGGLVDGVQAGDLYRYRVDGAGPYPDPASRFQPEGVHGPSEVIDPGRYAWGDDEWRGIDSDDLVLYELHVGTFSPEGTFAAVTERLEALRDLGVTAIELMPLADFAGQRSWGYDGVAFFAPARCYGSPEALRQLVDAAHQLGLAVILDVVYNHFGPVGNYTLQFSKQYLTQRETAWAACVNLDGEGCERVQEFFIENALHWVHEYHIDGLRLDATDNLHDEKDRHFLDEFVSRVRAASPEGRRVLLFAEDHRNLDILIRPREERGWDFDGVWADDYHHQARRLLAGDEEGYYRDYAGTTADLAATINRGWFYTGQHSINRDGPRGTDPSGIPPRRFVVCLQNHDQVGNRAFGERLHHQVDLAAFRAVSTLLLCLPQTPLLFMGQEWAASTPFQYFTDHDEELGRVVTEGRRREFRHFKAFADPEARETIPNPQEVETFETSRLDWSERDHEPHASTLRLYRALLTLRRTEPALRAGRIDGFKAVALDDDSLLLSRIADGEPSVWVVVRLRGSGTIDLGSQFGAVGSLKGCEVVLTTEDPSFAPDGQPPRVEQSGTAPVVHFARPSAVILRGAPAIAQNG